MENESTDSGLDIYSRSIAWHQKEPKGKLGIKLLKPLKTKDDLALAYSPGVARPCEEIAKNPLKAYDYTSKGNSVVVISNGTAVLGIGDIGALASKPVMEGKAMLLVRFAHINATDIEINSKDPQDIIRVVDLISLGYGAILLEDIKSPECFYIEDELKKLLDIPVFHDDQHGTAVVVLAGLINALRMTGRTIDNSKIVISGAGAAAVACIKLLHKAGVPPTNIICCDRSGVLYKGRSNDINKSKEFLLVDTPARNLAEAMNCADIFIGLSARGVVNAEMVKSMAARPIVFALANPEPEILPEIVYSVSPDAIVATGRSDYPNQVNNSICFPYIFRGALDVRASDINDEMKLAAAYTLAEVASKKGLIIPDTFDKDLTAEVPAAVAVAAMQSGVARDAIPDLEVYKESLRNKCCGTCK